MRLRMHSGVTPRTRDRSPPIQLSFSKQVICADAELFGKRSAVGIQHILFRPGEELGCPFGSGFVGPTRPEPTPGYVVVIEIFRGPPIGEADLKTSGQRDGFVPDNANPGGHDALLCGPVTLERQWVFLWALSA